MRTHSKLALSAALILVAYAAAAAEKDGPAFVPFPGGIADVEGNVGYITGLDGAIEALNLETGKVLWQSKEAQRPIALAGKMLLAQAMLKSNSVRVIGFDEKGKKVFESEPITFPDWLSDKAAGGRSLVSQARVSEGELWLRWRARAWDRGGFLTDKQVEERATKKADGVVRVNIKSGKVTMLERDKEPVELGPKVPDELRKLAIRSYPDFFGERKEVRTAGKLAFALDHKDGKLTLSRWDLETGKALAQIVLLEGEVFDWHLAPGGLVVARKNPPPKSLDKDYDWRLFDLRSGKKLAIFPAPTWGPITVLGPRAFYIFWYPHKLDEMSWGIMHYRLAAVDLKTGNGVWSRDLEPKRFP
jgi:hypothetical protein